MGLFAQSHKEKGRSSTTQVISNMVDVVGKCSGLYVSQNKFCCVKAMRTVIRLWWKMSAHPLLGLCLCDSGIIPWLVQEHLSILISQCGCNFRAKKSLPSSGS